MEYLAYLNVFLPLISSVIVGLFCKSLSKIVINSISCSLMFIAATASILIFFHFVCLSSDNAKISIPLFEWFFSVRFTITIDKLAAVMIFVVTVVSFLVHLYSVSYMKEDEGSNRFMSYLSLFTFFMLSLVVSDNLLQLFFGWEGVGLSSYLLIGFWYAKPQANGAAIKAFLVNRVADIFMVLGIAIVFYTFGSLNFDTIFSAIYEMNISSRTGASSGSANSLVVDHDILVIGCLALFIGCMGKSAQIVLHVWLPDAMEGPTPVSALIHAATMVTAGVFMVARCSPLFELAPSVLMFMMIVGSITAIFAATIAMAQFDIKKIIAYSTCSQLGYMFAACGASAYDAAIFHLFTHAFFKALLFLGAGSVIHALHGEQDIRQMGGLRKKIPITYLLMLIGTLAICGIYPLSGFYSKDLILEMLHHATSVGSGGKFSEFSNAALGASFIDIAWFSYSICLLTVGLTSFYSWRLFVLVFGKRGSDVSDKHPNASESGVFMITPMIILASGAILAGILGDTLGLGSRTWWSDVLALPKTEHKLVQKLNHDVGLNQNIGSNADTGISEAGIDEDTDMSSKREEGDDSTTMSAQAKASFAYEKLFELLPLIISVLGIATAQFTYVYTNGITRFFTRRLSSLYSLIYNKYYFDEIYNLIFVSGFRLIAKIIWKVCDVRFIDGIPNGLASLSRCLAYVQSRIHTGKIYQYSWVMFIALMLLIYYGIFRATDEMTFMQIGG